MYITQLNVFRRLSDTSSPLQNLSHVPSLLQEYKSCLATRKFDEAKKTNKEIHCLITNEINTTGWELKRFADDLVTKADCLEECVPVYFAAASLFKKEGNLEWMGMCVDLWGGIYAANKRMIERDVTMKEVVKRHMIPLMHEVKSQLLEATSVSEEVKCEGMSWVLDYIAESEGLVDDDDAAKEAMKESEAWEERRRIEEERRRIEEERNKPWWKKIMDVL